MKKEYPRVVVGVFIFNEKEELFLVKQPRWNNLFLVPGGKVEYGEDLVSAVKREVSEETGLEITDIQFVAVGEGTNLGEKYQGENKHLIYLHYRARVDGSEEIKLNDEGIEYEWKKPAEWLVDERVIDDVKFVIREHFIEVSDFKDRYLRALADYQNLLKRVAQEKQEFVKYANEQLLFDILPVYDNLKVSLMHIDEDGVKNGWVEGIKYVIKQFKDFLSGVGVEEIETVGKKFDHNTMEALEGEGEIVTKEMKAGYKLNGKVVVPAKVVVGGS